MLKAIRFIGTTACLSACLVASVPGYAQAKWWWESYPNQIDKSLSLKGASGGSVAAKQNPTGSNAGVAATAATQPPTVIIQQTASGTSTPSGFCVNFAPITQYNSNQQQISNVEAAGVTACPAIPGHNVTTIRHDASHIRHIVSGSWVSSTNQLVAACCYVPQVVSAPVAGAPSFSPWVSNTAFNSNGYTGSQHQDFVTPGTYSFTIPNGVFRVWVTVVGAGGAGGSGAVDPYNTGGYGGGGGGRGGIAFRKPIDVTPGSAATVQVGSGGLSNPGLYSANISGRAGYAGGASFFDINGYVVTSQGGFSGAGGHNGSGFYGEQQRVGAQYRMNDPRSGLLCNSCVGNGGPFGLVGVGVGTPGGNTEGGTGQGMNSYNNGPSNYGEGNTYNPTGGGKSGTGYHSSGGSVIASVGGGGGAAGFIGMPWSTSVPTATKGENFYNNPYTQIGGNGGFGYGAGGGGGAGVGTALTVSSAGAGGRGADGAVWIEW